MKSVFLWIILTTVSLYAGPKDADGVILLHGLARTSESMEKMAEKLIEKGYIVLNQDYPSTEDEISALSEKTIRSALSHELFEPCDRIHFVTHSMGGILVRDYFKRNKDKRLGRVVMLGPPNGGSEVVDKIGNWKLFKMINGPAGKELGTKPDSTPNSLGPVHFELGIIAGDRSINWINSLMIKGPDDGKVSVAKTKVDGMSDHKVVHATHPFLMKNDQVIQLTISFLESGKFPEI